MSDTPEAPKGPKYRVVVQADLARRVYHGVSKEETRYYLNGFCVEARPRFGGVTLVTTDGHILGAFFDDTGSVHSADGSSVIIKLSPEELKACRPGNKDFAIRWLVIDGDYKQSKLSIVHASEAIEAAQSADSGMGMFALRTIGQHFIDGSFPDWRRVIPHNTKKGTRQTFNADKIKQLADMVRGGSVAALQFADDGTLAGSPVLVTSPARSDWFGVLMPRRGATLENSGKLPEWVNPKAPAEVPPAEPNDEGPVMGGAMAEAEATTEAEAIEGAAV